MLRLPDKWLWDFWIARDGADYHVFYLQAPRRLEHEERRHWNVSIGHAVSDDLHNWDVLPDALRPSESPAWDDYTTWTGSIIRHVNRWYMFYTGTRHEEDGLVQRIGAASSTDLITWEKHPDNPLIEADPTWYELLDLDLWHDQAWRDPHVFQHPETGVFHALITARVNYGPADARGVIGHARSDNLADWDVLPPLTQPGSFGHLEIPQLVKHEDHWYLLFSTPANMYAAQYAKTIDHGPVTGTGYFMADDPLGPYEVVSDRFLTGGAAGSLYGGKLTHTHDNQLVLLAWRLFDEEGEFLGELSDPMPVECDDAGYLSVVLEEAYP